MFVNCFFNWVGRLNLLRHYRQRFSFSPLDTLFAKSGTQCLMYWINWGETLKI